MLQRRVIPVLLLQGNGLVKTIRFKHPRYVGDAVNAIKIFNDKGADELVLIDLDASERGVPIDRNRLRALAVEAFVPVTYGGGVRSLEDVESIITCGVERVLINTAAVHQSAFVRSAAQRFGESTLVVSVDYKRDWRGRHRVCANRGSAVAKETVLDFCKRMEQHGAGELVLHAVDRDGTMKGYDLKTLEAVARDVSIPVTVLGGGASYDDLTLAFSAGASGAAAGSVFVFSGPHRAVLINYPSDRAFTR